MYKEEMDMYTLQKTRKYPATSRAREAPDQFRHRQLPVAAVKTIPSMLNFRSHDAQSECFWFLENSLRERGAAVLVTSPRVG